SEVATSCCGGSSAAVESRRRPVNRQMTITDANPSIAESSPNPNKATEPATSAATIPIAPSSVIHARLNQDSAFARAISRSRSAGERPLVDRVALGDAEGSVGSSTGGVITRVPRRRQRAYRAAQDPWL